MEEIWQLTIAMRDGHTASIHGNKADLEPAYDSWLEAAETCDGVGSKIISAAGFHNSADRAEMRIAVLAEEIRSMTLVRYS